MRGYGVEGGGVDLLEFLAAAINPIGVEREVESFLVGDHLDS